MSVFKNSEGNFFTRLFKHKQVDEIAKELADTYGNEMRESILSENSETDTVEDTAAEPVTMLEVTESGEIDFDGQPQNTEGKSPPQDTDSSVYNSEVRSHLITFRVNDQELAAINKRYAETSFKSMKAASKALNEMTASNSTLEELEKAAHTALAKFTVMSAPLFRLSDRIHELEEQIPAIEKYHEYVKYHKKSASLEGKAKKKYKSDFCYELNQYQEAYKKLIELFPDGKVPAIKKLRDELESAKTEYAKLNAEHKAYKKEADKLSKLVQQKMQSQKAIDRYLQNEQAAKRKKGQLE